MTQTAAPDPPAAVIRRSDYVLATDDVDDPSPGTWKLWRGTVGDPDGFVTSFTRVPSGEVREAQRQATQELYGRRVRVVSWEQIGRTGSYLAITGEPHGAWQVLTYRGSGGLMWYRRPDDSWIGVNGSGYRNVESLDRMQGPLEPVEVHNLPALIAELEIYRRIAGYELGLEECFEGSCDDYVDDRGDPVDIDRCSHVQACIATADEVRTLHRIERELDSLRAEATVTPDQTSFYSQGEMTELGGVLRAVTAIQDAMEDPSE